MLDSLGFARNRCYSSKIAPEDLRNQMFEHVKGRGLDPIAEEKPLGNEAIQCRQRSRTTGEETRFPRST